MSPLTQAVALTALLTTFAAAQSPVPPPTCTPGMMNFSYYGFSGRPNDKTPYIATIRMTHEQHLADGNTIRASAEYHIARDAEGRTMQQQPFACLARGSEDNPIQYNVTLYDPVARTNTVWMVGSAYADKVVSISHMPEATRPAILRPAPTPEEKAQRERMMADARARQKEYKNEDLGTRTIAGVTAKGHRSTRTIPPGEEGNDLPLIVTTETWMADGITVLAITDDPRRGKSTYEVTELSFNEPPASTFALPEGYRINDHKPEDPTATPTPH